MRRLPSNLTQLSDLETRMAEEAAAMAKTRRALTRQRQNLEKKAQTARYILVGQLVEKMGLPIADLGALEQTLKTLGPKTTSVDSNHALSTTQFGQTVPENPHK